MEHKEIPNEVDFLQKEEMVGSGRFSLRDTRQQELQKGLISGGSGQWFLSSWVSQRSLGFVPFSGTVFFSES